MESGMRRKLKKHRPYNMLIGGSKQTQEKVKAAISPSSLESLYVKSNMLILRENVDFLAIRDFVQYLTEPKSKKQEINKWEKLGPNLPVGKCFFWKQRS